MPTVAGRGHAHRKNTDFFFGCPISGPTRSLTGAPPSCYPGGREPHVELSRTVFPRAQGLALIAPLLATVAAWAPLRHNYFHGDDFFHLYDIVTLPLRHLLGQVWGGHVHVLYNAAFWSMFQLFGTDPRGYAFTMLLTHLANTALLFQVIRQMIRPFGGVALACFGAMLWGTCPTLAGALGWYSVYPWVLLTTLVLSVLWSFGRLLRTGAPLSSRTAVVWVAVLAAGATCFGMGLGIAAAFPLVVAVALPRSQLPRRSALVLVAGAVITVAGYQLALTRSPDVVPEASAAVSLPSSPGLLVATFGLATHLVGFGGAALLLDGLGGHQRLPDWTQVAGASVLLLLIVAACASADVTGRRRVVALALLAGSAYGAVAAGRSAVYAAARVPLTMAARAERYHYLPLALLTLLLCAALAELASRGRAASRAVCAAVGVWMLCRLAMLALFPVPVELADFQRAAVAAVLRSVRDQAARTPPGEAVVIENRPFGASLFLPTLMPGNAAVFVVFSSENTVDGRPVRFVVSAEEWQRAQARGGRIAELLVQR